MAAFVSLVLLQTTSSNWPWIGPDSCGVVLALRFFGEGPMQESCRTLRFRCMWKKPAPSSIPGPQQDRRANYISRFEKLPTLVRHVVSQTTSAPPAQSSDRGAGKQTARSRVAFVGIGLLEVSLATQMIFMKKPFHIFLGSPWMTHGKQFVRFRQVVDSGG